MSEQRNQSINCGDSRHFVAESGLALGNRDCAECYAGARLNAAVAKRFRAPHGARMLQCTEKAATAYFFDPSALNCFK